ncbi:hypothetical protein ASE52_12400 [Acidovorax sp. Root275]|uniref:DUF3306 domain-containing protein n=1 Tax=Acidovorax sp. Root275 TaxID=1736508 RepID=UPI00070D66DB|nr:DUF3306 domain-containing protein [Acidovorax sp. Root275]KRD48181.1 hypothetical protein ASE52_12400 [Acidovorax sp. Root275]
MADGFLGRWSRRKQEVREGKPVEEPPPPAPPLPPPVASSSLAPTSAVVSGASDTAAEGAAPVAEAPPSPTLADAQALTPASDFKAFVARDVSPEVRNLAMKKLFADPHFNVMDGLDIYIGDYTQPDPLPEGMLRKMASAHAMGFFDHERKAEAEALPDVPVDGTAVETGADVGSDAIAPARAQPRDDAEGQAPADVAQSGVCNAIPSDPSREREVAIPPGEVAVAIPASHSEHDHDAHLRLQPDDAPQRQGVGRGAA